VLVGNTTHCMAPRGAGAGTRDGQLCALFVFFLLDTLSFSCSLGCIVVIVAISMPRRAYADEELEVGRFWLLLMAAWALLYVAVASGFGAFVASARAVYSQFWVLVVPLGLGVVLLALGVLVLWKRLRGLFPGGRAVLKATRLGAVLCCLRADLPHQASAFEDVETGVLLESLDEETERLLQGLAAQRRQQRQAAGGGPGRWLCCCAPAVDAARRLAAAWFAGCGGGRDKVQHAKAG
jgi:hypothetical protein